MSSLQNRGRDPEKRAAKRKARKEALARGAAINPKSPRSISQSQINHASSGKARKHAAEGEEKMENRYG